MVSWLFAIAPSRHLHSSMSAQPIPWTTPPCTCPRASVGFRTLPTSCTATKSMTRVAQVRRSTSTSATYAAHANAPYASPRYVLSSHAMPGGFSYAASPNSGSPGCSRCHRRMACFTVPPRAVSSRPTRRRRSSAARSISPPTIMVVRDATVGPEFGTREVSASAMVTSSGSRPSRVAASSVNTVSVPWPISMLALKTSTPPSGRPATRSRDLSATSPPPVNPAP